MDFLLYSGIGIVLFGFPALWLLVAAGRLIWRATTRKPPTPT